MNERKYVDPKADLTFKKIFGEHPDLITSLLNALLPLPEDGKIVSIEYLTPELVPDDPLNKDTIVGVRCKDQNDRQFIVENARADAATEKLRQSARKMKAKGFSADDIAELTGLNADEIARL